MPMNRGRVGRDGPAVAGFSTRNTHITYAYKLMVANLGVAAALQPMLQRDRGVNEPLPALFLLP